MFRLILADDPGDDAHSPGHQRSAQDHDPSADTTHTYSWAAGLDRVIIGTARMTIPRRLNLNGGYIASLSGWVAYLLYHNHTYLQANRSPQFAALHVPEKLCPFSAILFRSHFTERSYSDGGYWPLSMQAGPF